MKILVLDGVSEKGVQILREPGFEVDVINEKLTEDQLIEMIPNYNGVIVRSATKITARVIENARNLSIIGRAGVGVDNIDVDAATNHGIVVVNAPDGNTIAAAEHTMALMLAVARFVPQANGNLKQGKWMRKEYTGVELRGKTLGVIGIGRIGTAVTKRAQGFEMNVVAFDPFVTAERAEALGVETLTLDEVFKRADFITVHMPLNKDTKDMIDTEAISKMKDGVRIINVARGGIVNQKDLYNAVKEGKVAGAALDVFEVEPTTESELFELDNVVVTPHLGASTEEAQINVALDVAHEMVAVLQGEMAKNAVNLPPIPKEVLMAVLPYMSLGEKLGKIAAQLTERNDAIEIIYSGEVAKLTVAPITTNILKGFLSVTSDQTINVVNAPIIAKNKGIKILETKSEESEDYKNLITVRIKGENQEKAVAGTVYSHNDARIAMIGEFFIDIVPEGNLIITHHSDKPKVIGSIGSIIGEHSINIGSMQVGRKSVGGKAVMVMTVDSQVGDEVLGEISKIDGMIDVRFVSL